VYIYKNLKQKSMTHFSELPFTSLESNPDFSVLYSPFVLITYEDGFKGVGRFRTDFIEDEDINCREYLGGLIKTFIANETRQGIMFDGTNNIIKDHNINPFEDIIKIEYIDSFADVINADKSQPQRAMFDYLITTSKDVNIKNKKFWELIRETAIHQLNIHKETGSFN
jgi:hypothetical protein